MKVGSSDATTTPRRRRSRTKPWVFSSRSACSTGWRETFEPLGQLVLGDALAGRQLAVADRVEDGAIDAIG